MYIFDNLIVNCFFQGAPKEEILRCSVADDNTYSDNVFLNKQLTNEAEKDFETVKLYAVEIEHLSSNVWQGQTLRKHHLPQEGLTMTNY